MLPWIEHTTLCRFTAYAKVDGKISQYKHEIVMNF